jgi:magnesium transporter
MRISVSNNTDKSWQGHLYTALRCPLALAVQYRQVEPQQDSLSTIEVALRNGMTAEQAIAHLQAVAPDSETVYYLFVVGQDERLVGVVSLREPVISPPSARVEEIMDPDVIYVRADADREEAARLMSRYSLMALPVVDDDGHLLGIITHDDLAAVLEVEATEDIYCLGGVSEEQPADVPFHVVLRSRLPWLVLNLGTAMISVAVLSTFESTIAQVAALAAFFPVVSGVSGSAGTQALTVILRRLALGELNTRAGFPVLSREVIIGLANGLTIGGLVVLIALTWKGMPALGLVVGSATLLNMLGAGTAGVVVPLGMILL